MSTYAEDCLNFIERVLGIKYKGDKNDEGAIIDFLNLHMSDAEEEEYYASLNQ